MTTPGFGFRLLHVDEGCGARRGELRTPHGLVQLPAFLPVGTQATVKGLNTAQLEATGTEMILGNVYHLALRPGPEVIAELGGLHRFMGWNRPILADSGGYQLFSLAERTMVCEEYAQFRSHIDGRLMTLSPEKVIAIQEALGVDVAMVLDHVVGLPAERNTLLEAAERTVRWAKRSLEVATRSDQALFAIVQGGLEADLRIQCARELRAMDFAGYAVGGLSVGETQAEMLRVLEITVPELPADKPRYLMGVGRPEDILEAVRRGIDMFDCVLPTRNGRNAVAFTDEGPIRVRSAKFIHDEQPLEACCGCVACRHSRAYIRHLFAAREMLGPILLTIHNLTYYQRLMTEARRAIEADCFDDFRLEKLRLWAKGQDENCSGSR